MKNVHFLIVFYPTIQDYDRLLHQNNDQLTKSYIRYYNLFFSATAQDPV